MKIISSTILWCVFNWKCCTHYVSLLQSIVSKWTINSSLKLMRGTAWWGGIRCWSREKNDTPKAQGHLHPWCEGSGTGLFWQSWVVDSLTLLHAADRGEEMQVLRSVPGNGGQQSNSCDAPFRSPDSSARLHGHRGPACQSHQVHLEKSSWRTWKVCQLRVKVSVFKALVNAVKSTESIQIFHDEYNLELFLISLTFEVLDKCCFRWSWLTSGYQQ